jgi:hypothetical protein
MEGSDILRQHRIALDRGIKDVMPDSWEGHARLAIRQSEDVPESIEDKVIVKANKIAYKKGVSPERAANALISKLVEKQG